MIVAQKIICVMLWKGPATPTKIAEKDLNVDSTTVQNALREKTVVTGSPMKTAASRE